MCNTVSDCNDRGICVEGECACDVAYFGDTCYDNLKTFLPKAFVTYQAIFLIIYCLIALVSFIKLYIKVKKEKHIFAVNNLLFTIKTLRSPYNLSMLSILLIAITRIFWLAIDPFAYNDIFHRSVERLFFESTYSLLFVIYAIVLSVWYSIYDEISRHNDKRISLRFRCFKTKVKIFVFIVVVAQLTTSILKGFHREEFSWSTIAIYCFLFIIFVIVILEYMVYGWFLYMCISDQEKAIMGQYDRLVSNTPQTGAAAAAYQAGNSQSRIDSRRGSHSRRGSQLEDELRKKTSIDRGLVETSRFNESEKDGFMQPNQAPESPNTSQSRSRIDFYGKNVSEPLKKVGFMNPSELVIDEDIEEIEDEDNSLEVEPVRLGARTKTTPPALRKNLSSNKLVPFYSMKKSSDSLSYLKKSQSVAEKELFDKEVKDIVKRHEEFLKPVEIVEYDDENLATNISVIIDDNEDVVWEYTDDLQDKKREEELKMKEDLKVEIKKTVAQMRMKDIVIQYMNTIKKTKLGDAFQMRLLDDITYLKNHQEITKNDKMIIKKIMSLTIIAIMLEILFGLLTLFVFYTPVLQSPIGTIFSMWMTGFLEVFGIFAIFGLFSIVQTQEKDNLRLIMRIGQNRNRINRLYGFVLPKYLRQEESKRRLEKTINQMTAKYMKSITTLPNGG